MNIFIGGPAQRFGSSTGGDQVNGSATAGYDFRFAALRLTPYATLQGSNTGTAAYTETESFAGVPIADERGNQLGTVSGRNSILYGSQQASSLNVAGGLEASYQLETSLGLFIPSVKAEYHHEFISSLNDIPAILVNESEGNLLPLPLRLGYKIENQPTPSTRRFAIPTAATASNYGLLGLDARLLLHDGTNVTLEVEHAVGQGVNSFSIVTLTLSRYF